MLRLTATQIQQYNELEIMDFEMISPINVVEKLMLEFDEFEAKIQEADGVWGIQEFDNKIFLGCIRVVLVPTLIGTELVFCLYKFEQILLSKTNF